MEIENKQKTRDSFLLVDSTVTLKNNDSLTIFFVEKSKNYLGIHKFNYLSHNNNTKILALGGISESNINKLKLLNIKGFGGISIFKKKPASLRPVSIKNNFF